jgi:hypothetical protein
MSKEWMSTIPKRLLEMKIAGKRSSGIQHTWWIDQVKRDIDRRGQSWGKVEEMQG